MELWTPLRNGGGGKNEVSGPGCEMIPPATLQVPNREERSPVEKEGANGGDVAKRGKGGDGARRKKGKSNEEVPKKEDDSIRCFCQSKVEKREMVCCDACSGWFHLKCMGMKKGAEVMKEKEFVCHFCVSSIMLSMREEISGLRRELEDVKSEMKKLSGRTKWIRAKARRTRVGGEKVRSTNRKLKAE